MTVLKRFAWLMGLAWAAGCGGAVGDVEDGAALFHDVGPVFVDAGDRASWEVRHDFVFRNPSEEHTARLEVESQSCGCGEYIAHDDQVPPGEEATITLAYNLRLRQEKRRESVLLATGLPEQPRIVLSLAAEGYPRLTTSPERLPDLSVRPGRTEAFDVTTTAYWPESEPREPLEASVEGPGLSLIDVREQQTVRVTEGVHRDVTTFVLRIAMPEVDGPVWLEDTYDGSLEIRRGRHRLTRVLRWSPLYHVRSVPDRLFLRAGAEAMTVRLTAAETFAISSIHADHPMVEWSRVSRESGAEQVLEVRAGSQPEEAQVGTSALRVEIDHPEQRLVKIPVFVLW